MINWRHAKLHISGMTIEEKRRLYRCRDQFKTVNDIVDWGAYVRTDEAKAKLASYYAGKDSHKKDEKPQTNEEQCDSKVTGDNDDLDEKSNTGKDKGDDQSGSVKESSESDVLNEEGSVQESSNVLNEEKTSIVESKAVEKPLTLEHSEKMEVAGESKVGDKPTTSVDTSKIKPTSGDTGKIDMKVVSTDESKSEDKSVTREGTSTAEGQSGFSSRADVDEGEAAQTDTEKKFPRNDVLNGKISLFTGDITCLEIDAIVNAANEDLYCGGGVDNAIHTAAGYALLRSECDELDGCDTGDAKITSGYKLPAKYVIHAVGPKGKHPNLLRNCYNRSMDLLKEHELETIAFPCISTGIYGYPNENAAEVALETIRKWLDEDEYSAKVKRVIFCLFLQTDIKIYHKLMSKYFPFE